LARFASANSARNRRFSASKVDGLSRCGFAGILVLAHPDSQGFFAQTELVRDTGDRSVRGVRIGLGMDDELDGTSLEFVGVFHWQERISFFQSPCLYYPRGDSVLSPKQVQEMTAYRDSLNPAKIAAEIARVQDRLLVLSREKTEQLYLAAFPPALPEVRTGVRVKTGSVSRAY
jgi:hypothetical protein